MLSAVLEIYHQDDDEDEDHQRSITVSRTLISGVSRFLNERIHFAEDRISFSTLLHTSYAYFTWEHLRSFVKWLSHQNIVPEVAEHHDDLFYLWELGREFEVPKFQDDILQYLCNDGQFYKQLNAWAILRLFNRVTRNGWGPIQGHKLLRFCLDIVTFQGPKTQLFKQLIEQGGPLAILVAEDAIDFSLKKAVSADWISLRWEEDPRLPGKLHRYLMIQVSEAEEESDESGESTAEGPVEPSNEDEEKVGEIAHQGPEHSAGADNDNKVHSDDVEQSDDPTSDSDWETITDEEEEIQLDAKRAVLTWMGPVGSHKATLAYEGFPASRM